MGITSTGKGNAPKVATHLDSSTTHKNRCAMAATIFSRVKAAPPPLIMQPEGSISSAPSTYQSKSVTSLAFCTAYPTACKRWLDASELDTTAAKGLPAVAKASINAFTVEPVPTPSRQ